MRVACWALFAVSLVVSVLAKGKAKSQDNLTCLAPSAVASFESKIAELQESNAALQLQLETAKAQLEDKAPNHEVDVSELQKEIHELKKNVASEKQGFTLELNSALNKLSTETKRAATLDNQVTKLKMDLATEQAASSTASTELKAAVAEKARQAKKIAQLEKTIQSMDKKNKALLKDLSDSTPVDLSLASLLSSYYDEALVLAEDAAGIAQQKLHEQSDTLDFVQGQIKTAKTTAWDTTSSFYAENLAATFDPVLANVHEAVHPHTEKYLPLLQTEGAKAKDMVIVYSQKALRHAKRARLEAIALLEQNEHVAQHARKIIDGVLIVLAVPVVMFQVRLALRLVWWVLTTTLCVLTCGLCCGARKRSSNTKLKVPKKTAGIHQSLKTPLNGPGAMKMSSKSTAMSQKRGKKSKN
ncbi:hypothetical protein CCR75_004922 [Bremia lactucae]|uniref:Uncharacterized protein n=1 Tax=Bremia lactucae TaxID=4779 RepID=A0A976FLN8_BRELC|nr:hypothetical protein CCR75_004922 [Bremia lactucae]